MAPTMIAYHPDEHTPVAFQLGPVAILPAHAVNVDLVHSQGVHQNLLPNRVLFLGADSYVADFQGNSPFHFDLPVVNYL